MKKYILPISISMAILLGVVSLNLWGTEKAYSLRTKVAQGISGYAEYLKQLRANQVTGSVSNADVAEVINQIKMVNALKTKATWPLNWDFRGPDNVGGRTRCLVIDKNNPSILYTGGVSGSVFKSTNKGVSWYPLTNKDDNFGVMAMAQTSDGAIFYGTGENGLYLNADGNENSSFNGMGLFKSTDGISFTKVPNSQTLGNIYVLTVHPTQNILYLGSSSGLRMSNDGGTTWTLIRGGSCKDIKISKNGVALAYIGSSFYRAADAANKDSYTLITGLTASTRGAAAWSESDPNYCYLVAVGSVTLNGAPYNSALRGLFKSTNAGATWTQEVGQASQFFAPFTIIGVQSQGDYNMALAVHPRDKDRVFIGGIQMAEWTASEGPKIVGNTFNSPTNPFGIHSDKHYITFDNTGTDPIMYICSDGGVARTTDADLSRYKDISLNYSTTQFFGIAASTTNQVMGGTQDNNTMLLKGETYPRKNAIDLLGGDGFQCEISQFNPKLMFAENQYGGLNRSTTGGDDMNSFWDNRVAASFATPNNPNRNITGYFDNPLCIWENPDVVSRVKSTGPLAGDDTLVNTRIFFAMNNGIWMCNNAHAKSHDPANPKDKGAVRWFRIADYTGLQYIKTSKDGNSLFACTNNGRVYRIDGLRTATFDTATIPGYSSISNELTFSNITSNLGSIGRTITSIDIDNADPNRAVVSMGNYGNNNYVYITKDLMTTTPTWTSIQGALPKFPVYHALISEDNPDVILLGTEFGVWATNNGSATTPTWAEAGAGVNANLPLPRVPVFELVQIKEKLWSGVKIYAGTHGMGIWETSSLTSSIRNPGAVKNDFIKAYPNPANNFVNLETDLVGAYTLSIYNLKGQVVETLSGQNSGSIRVNTESLTNGNYFVEIISKNRKAVTKIIVQH